MSVTAREAALQALIAYRTRDARPDMILGTTARKEGLSRRDTALAAHIVNGVLQNLTLCDYYVETFADRRATELEPVVLDILRLSVYQIAFLDRVPAHAAVSEGVELSKKYAKRASGLVNAVLRKAAQRKGNMPPVTADTPVRKMAIEYSHPEWLVGLLADEYGTDGCESILEANNAPSSVTLIVNTLKTTAADVVASVKELGAEVKEHPYIPNAVDVSGAGAIDAMDIFKDGHVYVQDAAAYMAVYAADPKPGYTVLDTCAAPGGKSFSSAIRMGNTGSITSCDIHEKKLRQIVSGAERLGISIINTFAQDAREPYTELIDRCDLVITDVPCSGIGVIRKKPEIRYKKPGDLERLPEIQLGILENASKCVKPGGTLLYSTCTILKRENEAVAEEFLRRHAEFSLDPFTLPGPFGKCCGMRTILPHEGGTDGFFICKMKRRT